MEFGEIIKRAKEIRGDYKALVEEKGREQQNISNYTQKLMVDVADLIKLVMAKEDLKKGEDVDKELAHELSDCLWSILVIADELDVDLEREFLSTMVELEKKGV